MVDGLAKGIFLHFVIASDYHSSTKLLYLHICLQITSLTIFGYHKMYYYQYLSICGSHGFSSHVCTMHWYSEVTCFLILLDVSVLISYL